MCSNLLAQDPDERTGARGCEGCCVVQKFNHRRWYFSGYSICLHGNHPDALQCFFLQWLRIESWLYRFPSREGWAFKRPCLPSTSCFPLRVSVPRSPFLAGILFSLDILLDLFLLRMLSGMIRSYDCDPIGANLRFVLVLCDLFLRAQRIFRFRIRSRDLFCLFCFGFVESVSINLFFVQVFV